jgi:hypothetical protein
MFRLVHKGAVWIRPKVVFQIVSALKSSVVSLTAATCFIIDTENEVRFPDYHDLVTSIVIDLLFIGCPLSVSRNSGPCLCLDL